MKFLKTHRFDESDTFAFPKAAEPSEWAVPGAFMFAGRDAESLSAKEKLALRTGFLGLGSLGWSSFVIVASCDQGVIDDLVATLARYGVERLGAPSLQHAMKAAAYEIEFAASLGEEPPPGTILRVERQPGETGMHEAFRIVRPPSAPDGSLHARVFDIVPDEETSNS